MRILNLYAGIGGNRALWGDEHEITSVEYKPEIAAVYQELYPDDTVVVADAITEAQIQELTLLDNAYDESKSNFHEYYFDRLAYLTTKKEAQ